MLTEAVHIAIAAFFALYLWSLNYSHFTAVYVFAVFLYAGYCKCLHPLDTMLIFLGTLILHALVARETFEGKRSKRKQEPEEHDEDEDDEKFQDAKDAHMDLGSTFLTAYKKLNPEQVADMREDTKQLIETQKELMSTLSTMGPAINDGLAMIDSFKQYFGSGQFGALAQPGST